MTWVEKEGSAMTTMMSWTKDELTRIGNAEELHIASVRRDGKLTDPVTIWVVRHEDDLYVRSVNGRAGTWFRRAQVRNEGHIQADGIGRDVSFTTADPDLGDEIDATYRRKYHRYGENILASVVSRQARAATIRLIPRS
jgi:hypothetical protein